MARVWDRLKVYDVGKGLFQSSGKPMRNSTRVCPSIFSMQIDLEGISTHHKQPQRRKMTGLGKERGQDTSFLELLILACPRGQILIKVMDSKSLLRNRRILLIDRQEQFLIHSKIQLTHSLLLLRKRTETTI